MKESDETPGIMGDWISRIGNEKEKRFLYILENVENQ